MMDAQGQSLGTRGLRPSFATFAIIWAADSPSYTSCLRRSGERGGGGEWRRDEEGSGGGGEWGGGMRWRGSVEGGMKIRGRGEGGVKKEG